MVRRLTLDQEIEGSNPCSPANTQELPAARADCVRATTEPRVSRADVRRRRCASTRGHEISARAPSSAKWFGHDPARWPEFQSRYHAELAEADKAHALDALASQARRGPVTIVYGARDREHNQARVIADELERRIRD